MGRFFARIYILVVFLVIVLPISSKETYNILFVQSYTENDTWSEELNDGLRKGFADASVSAKITTEYLNSRYWDKDGEEEVMRRICRRAADRETELIVVSNDEALYTLMICGDSLPYNVPVVFLDVEFPNAEIMADFTNITGLTSPHPYDKLLETAQYIFPNRKNVVLLSETTFLGKKGGGGF